jgi:hypothetical protein
MDQGEFEKLQTQVATIQAQVDVLKEQLESNRAFSEQMGAMFGICWQKDSNGVGEQLEDKKPEKGKKRKGKLLKCSFCSKSQDDVKKLIAGPGVFICDECVILCSEILDEELFNTPESAPQTLLKAKKSGGFHSSVRSFVLDAVVVQAMAGAPWKDICADVMAASGISQEEVEQEIGKMRGERPVS